ncbi:MAG: bifunctional DNA primase/polymerase [Candidatus Zipacnadales bacterium]
MSNSQTKEYQAQLLQAAFTYAAYGWKVFPLAERGKTPRQGSHGHLEATTDDQQILQWWGQGVAWNIGIATGQDSRLVVLDIDRRHRGDKKLRELEARYGRLPHTVQVQTAGGWHLYFAHPGGQLRCTLGVDWAGVDIKADGGYIVAPPSTHPEGSLYKWTCSPEKTAVAELPGAWKKLLTKAPSPATCPASPTTPTEAPPLRPGQRHTALTSLAGRLVKAGLTGRKPLEAALQSFNAERCDPPLPVEEVNAIARSAANWEAPAKTVEPSADIIAVLTGVQVKKLVRNTSWVWPRWIANEHLTVLAGESGVGKSWLALALAKAAAHGLPWPDGQAGGGTKAPVLWLESEGRLALLIERAEKMGFNLNLLRFMPQPLRTYYLDREEDFRYVAKVAEFIKPRLVVVDSWSKSFAGKENDAEIRFCLDNLQGLARTLSAPLLLIHHLRKRQLTDHAEGFDFDRLRGSSVLAQVATTIIGVDQPQRRSPTRRVSCGKANLGPLPEPFSFVITDAGLTFGGPLETTAPTSRLEEAQEFLTQFLASGPRLAREVKAAAKQAGISENALRMAKRNLCKTEHSRGTKGNPVRWSWRLLIPSLEQ